MLCKLLFSFLVCINFLRQIDGRPDFQHEPDAGPLSLEEAELAQLALDDPNGDILIEEDPFSRQIDDLPAFTPESDVGPRSFQEAELAQLALNDTNGDILKEEDPFSKQIDDLPAFTPESDVGPRSFQEAELAHQALHGPNGDILLEDDLVSRAGIKDTKYRWPGYPGKGIVPYVIHSSLASIKNLIQQAMEQYHKSTCIRFVPRKNQRNYINIVKGTGGCSSYVGMINKGDQPVKLGRGCEYLGTIVHELGHAIGLYHEHQRSDRDKYITVFEKNVTSGSIKNFKKTNPNDELILTEYDYNSIMHYGNYAFSKSPRRLMAMVAKNGQKLLAAYDKKGFTKTDIEMVKKLYKCK